MTTQPSQQPILQLTVRERYVLGLLAQGMLYKEIAYDNKISIDTVKKHSKNIYKKLGARNRSEAAMHWQTMAKAG
jgi:NarL family two-component system response regulator LiaR